MIGSSEVLAKRELTIDDLPFALFPECKCTTHCHACPRRYCKRDLGFVGQRQGIFGEVRRQKSEYEVEIMLCQSYLSAVMVLLLVFVAFEAELKQSIDELGI